MLSLEDAGNMEQCREKRFNFLCASVQVFQPKTRGHQRPYGLRRPSLGELRLNPGVPGMKHSLAGAEPGYGTPPIGVLSSVCYNLPVKAQRLATGVAKERRVVDWRDVPMLTVRSRPGRGAVQE
jgi:hypothetical protein